MLTDRKMMIVRGWLDAHPELDRILARSSTPRTREIVPTIRAQAAAQLPEETPPRLIGYVDWSVARKRDNRGSLVNQYRA